MGRGRDRRRYMGALAAAVPADRPVCCIVGHPVHARREASRTAPFARSARRDLHFAADIARTLKAHWILDPRLPLLYVDPRQMQQVFLNLLLNAADAMGGPGVVTLRSAESIEGGQRRAAGDPVAH